MQGPETGVILHTLRMGDVDDPYLYAAFPIWEWQQTDHGKWCMEHSTIEPYFECWPDRETLGFKVVLYGKLTDMDHTYYMLKWGAERKYD